VLRRGIKAAMAVFSDRERRASDDALFARFLALPEVMAANTILLFYGVGGEPHTAELIAPLTAMGKTLALPRCRPERQMEARVVTAQSVLSPSAYGIPEPGEDCPVLKRGMIDLILVPALCYDRQRCRLGQGGGYYDRYLAGYQGCTVGLCRDYFLQEDLPIMDTDIPVGLVLTETIRICNGTKRG